jgi:adenine-specific DNA-methyltransferase
LTQVILNLWLTLDLPIEEKSINWNQVFYVAWNSLVACFDKWININTIEEIAKAQPIKIVFCDLSFKSDEDRINVENKVRRVSPETKISVI